MAYRLTALTDHVYVGQNSAGDLNIEIWSGPKADPDSECQHDIFVPADALDALYEYLRRAA